MWLFYEVGHAANCQILDKFHTSAYTSATEGRSTELEGQPSKGKGEKNVLKWQCYQRKLEKGLTTSQK